MDFKQAREAAGLTLDQVAERAGYSVAAVNGMELRNEGSQRLRDKLTQILSDSRSTVSELREGDDLRSERDLWMRRAKSAESELHKIKTVLRRLADPVPLPEASSGRGQTFADRLAGKVVADHEKKPAT